MPGIELGVMRAAKIVARAHGEEEDTKVRVRISSKLDLRDLELKDKLDAALLLGLRVSKTYGPGRKFWTLATTVAS